MIARAWSWFTNRFAILVVIAAFIWSSVTIISHRRQAIPPGVKTVLRIGHWQLEGGVREAFNAMIAEYQELHPDVMIVQDAIPESTYGQWFTTQLMGGTAPDMIQVGLGVPYNVLLGFYHRYFLPLSMQVNQPNPYNRGSDFETMPWRQTYKDAMRRSYIEELQEYMTIPLSQFGSRIFYNKDLLKSLTGLEEPPADFRTFLAACEAIQAQRLPDGKAYVPIASSAYHITNWEAFMCAPLTFGAVREADFNRDGYVGVDELYYAIKTGRIDFDAPPFEASFRMLRTLTNYFQTGFSGLGRDEAVMLFAQQRAVFIISGTWEAGSLEEQARDHFELGIMDFPYPTKDDPEYGNIIEGPRYEAPASNFNFAVTRTSKNPEAAIDFLQFLSSRAGNEKMNGIIGWIPAIKGTSVSRLMSAFEPHLEGTYSSMPVTVGGETIIKWTQLTSLFQIGQIDYEEMVRQYKPLYLDKGGLELIEIQRNRRRALIRDEQFVTGYRHRALMATGDELQSRMIKYRQMVAGRLINRELGNEAARTWAQANADTPAPYSFTPEVLAKIRARLTNAEPENTR